MSNNFVQSKQKKNLFQKVATKSSIPKEKWLSIEMGKYPKNSANDWKFVTIGKKCEKYFSKSIDRVLTSSSIFFPISFLFLNWNSSSAWSHRMPFLSLRSSISHLFFTSHCILLHQSTSGNYNIGNEKTKPLATEKKTSIFNGQFTVLHLKAYYRYGPITGMLIVITQSISEKMRSLLIHLCREWRLVNEDWFFLANSWIKLISAVYWRILVECATQIVGFVNYFCHAIHKLRPILSNSRYFTFQSQW